MRQSLLTVIKAVVYLGVAVFILLSLLSYDPCDTSFRCSQVNIPVNNLTGIIGAYIAEGLFLSFGWASYAICLLAIIWAAARFLEKPEPRFYVKFLGTIVLLASLPVLLSLFGAQEKDARFIRAGLVGFSAAEFLLKYFGRAGTLIIALGLTGLSSFVASEFLIFAFFRGLIKGLLHFILILKDIRQSPIFGKKQLFRERTRPTIKITKPQGKPIKEQPPATERPFREERPRIKIVKPAPVKKAEPKPVAQKVSFGDYQLPSLDLLNSPPPIEEREIKEDLEANSQILEGTLRDFGVEVKVTQISPGPVITRYELEPAPGVKVHRIVDLGDDIALAMKAHSVRIVAPIPGKARVGVEVPNSKSAIVYLKEILESQNFQHADSKLTLAVGKDISGQPIVTDLSDMPHLLIAGTTGSGKTVCVNSIITSVLFNATPEEVKFLMVDPKMVELALFNDLPHLLCPVLTDPKKVSAALAWVVGEMERRFQMLSKVGARNIDIYNQKISAAAQDEEGLEKMPYLIVIIDELADLMVVASQQVENAITRLAQLSRAVGIHLILATQRPSVDVITGVIKANFPARISFRVASKVDSRTVLDMNGADKLLGKGDLLFLRPGQHKPVRAQGSLIFDSELERIVNFIKKQKPSVYNQELLEAQEKKGGIGKTFEKDELFDEAVRVIMQTKQASVSMLQRRLGLGYTRAARLIDMMEEEGIVGPYRGSKPREILVEREDYLLNQNVQGEQDQAQ
ncbi:MAG: DNA translocase FtsK [Candidatus Omnitrophica bacterium]|nr:DNA translocase FtsK [Candidatus Omnitrophota bacterium]